MQFNRSAYSRVSCPLWRVALFAFLVCPAWSLAAESVWVRVDQPSSAVFQAAPLSDYGTFAWGEVSADELAALQASGARVQVIERPFELRLGGLNFDPLTEFPRLDSEGHHARDPGHNFRLIQFEGPIRGEWLQNVRGLGIEIVQYVSPFTYVVWADQVQLGAARGADGVRWTGEFATEFRVIPEQRDFTAPDEATMLAISRYADERAVRQQIEAAGGEVLRITPYTSHFRLVMLIAPGRNYMDLGRIAAVYTVQRAPVVGVRGEMTNQSIVGNYGPEPDHEVVPGYQTWLDDTGYDGSGVTVSVIDGGIRTTHVDLADRIVPCVPQGSPTSCTTANSDHGTHVAGAVAGTGATGTTAWGGFLRGQGVAPAANVVQQRFSGLNYPWGAQCTDPQPPDGGYCLSPDGMLILLNEAHLSGATHANNSWGSVGIKIGYDLPTQQVDVMTRDADPDTPGQQPVLPVWSIMNGNGDTPGACNNASLGSPDEAKNLFAVGSTRLQTSTGNQLGNIFDVGTNSAHGPACDGRVGVHIVAPGQFTDSTSASSDTGHRLWDGTSFSSPVVSGAIAVFIERYRDLEGADPSPAMMKAAFSAVATNLHGFNNADNNPITETPSRFQGWGRLDLDAVVNPPNNVMYFDQEEVFTATGQEWTLPIIADDPNEPVRLMLIWTDAHGPGLAGDTPAWVNDLDLVVQAGADTYLGNRIGPDGFSQTGGNPDEINNMEGVFLRPDQHNGNTFDVNVLAANIVADALNPHDPDTANPTQDFALVCYNCDFGDPTFSLSLEPQAASACVPAAGTEDLLVEVAVGAVGNYTGTVNLSTSGEPAGVTSDLDPDTVAVPGDSDWTLTLDTTAPVGTATILLIGDDGDDTHDAEFMLTVDEPLSGPGLLMPADGATNVDLLPEFSWDALAGAVDYQIQVATDAGFVDIVIDEVLDGTGFTPDTDLATGTDFFWRVRGLNTCGDGAWSAEWMFQTRFEPIADISPAEFSFTVQLGNTDTDTLFIENVGTGMLDWSIETDQIESAPGLLGHDPLLDEGIDFPTFTIEGDASDPPPVVFEMDAGVLTRGDVVGFSFVGTVEGPSGTSSLGSDTCMIIEAPDGTIYSVGGFSGAIPHCGSANNDAGWNFGASGDDGTYTSDHDDAFDPPLEDQGVWTFTFINAWLSANSVDMTWSDVTVTLHKQPLPVCVEDLTDVPWLSVNPVTGSTPGGDTDDIDVMVDTDGLSDGTHEGFLCVSTNTTTGPQLVPIPVTLNVIDPDAGILEGTVTSAGYCGDDPHPVVDALVTVEGSMGGEFSTLTDENGFYSFVINESQSPVDITVEADGYIDGEATGVVIESGMTTVEDFDLDFDSPCIDVDPEEISDTLAIGEDADHSIDISNLGVQTLNWEIFEPVRQAASGRDAVISAEDAFEVVRGDSDPLIGFNFSSGTVDPPNWNRISSASGSMADVMDDTGAATDVSIEWSGIGSYVATSTLGGDAVPQYDYDLTNMTGYGFQSGGQFSVELSGLQPNSDYEYWFVGYRASLGIHNVVNVSDGDTVDAFQFEQLLPSASNDGRFYVNEVIADNTMHWNDLSAVTRSSSSGTITFNWSNGGSDPTVIGAIAIRQAVTCEIPDWLSVAPTAGTIEPGDPSQTITANLDATGLAPGNYDASICIESNDAIRPIVPLPVTLEVTLPGDFATIEGTVESAGYCNANPAPLAGATVQIEGSDGAMVTLTTDENGFYETFLPDSESPIDITVSAPGHIGDEVTGVNFGGGDTVVEDFELLLDAPCATVDPDNIETEVGPDGTTSETLTIGNIAGGAVLSWDIETAEVVTLDLSRAAREARNDPGPESRTRVTGGAEVETRIVDIRVHRGQSLSVLVLSPDGEIGTPIPPTNLVDDLNAFPDIEATLFTDPVATVTVADLVGYDVVMTTNNNRWDSVGADVVVGDALADYIDAGGKVVVFSFVYDFFGWQLAGRFIDEDYGPFHPATDEAVAAVNMVVLEPDHPLFESVTSLGYSGETSAPRLSMATQPGAELLADWSDGLPLIAVNEDVVAFNAVYSQDGQPTAWSGDLDILTRNAALWLVGGISGCAAPEDIDWLTVTPDSGTTPPGGTSDVQVNFDAAGLDPGDYEALLCVNSDDPVNSLIEVPVLFTVLDQDPGELDVDPDALAFGEVLVGESATMSFDVLNVADAGAADLSLTAIIASGAGFEVTGGSCEAGVTELEAGDSCTVEIMFSPGAVGPFAGDVTVEGTSLDSDLEAVVSLTGEGIMLDPGALELNPSNLGFGNVAINTTITDTLTLTNTAGAGSAPVLVSSIEFLGHAEFADTGEGTCVAGETELDPGESCTIEAAFAPESVGNFAGSVVVDGNDGKNASALLSGSGIEPEDDIFSDRFEE